MIHAYIHNRFQTEQRLGKLFFFVDIPQNPQLQQRMVSRIPRQLLDQSNVCGHYNIIIIIGVIGGRDDLRVATSVGKTGSGFSVPTSPANGSSTKEASFPLWKGIDIHWAWGKGSRPGAGQQGAVAGLPKAEEHNRGLN